MAEHSYDSSSDPDRCRFCKFWHTTYGDRRADGHGWQGVCRIHAVEEFPHRYSHEWCGDFIDNGLRKRLALDEARLERNEAWRVKEALRDRALKAEKALKAARIELRTLKGAR